MKRRHFLYLSGVGGAGILMFGSNVSAAGDASVATADEIVGNALQHSAEAQAVSPTQIESEAVSDTQVEPQAVSSVRIVLPAGAGLSLTGSGIVDLRYTSYLEGASSLDVVDGSARLTAPVTTSESNFQNQVNDLVFEVPTADTELHASEMIVYNSKQAARLQRPSAKDTFMFVAAADQSWHVIHIADATADQVILDVLEITLPTEQPAAA